MKVRVQFFSRLRELAGVGLTDFEVPEKATVADLLNVVYAGTPALRDWDKSILVASGLDFVDRNYVINPSDQISVMPPVQGG